MSLTFDIPCTNPEREEGDIHFAFRVEPQEAERELAYALVTGGLLNIRLNGVPLQWRRLNGETR